MRQPPHCQKIPAVLLCGILLRTGTAFAQLICYEGFGGYGGGTQAESGGNGSGGTGLEGGTGWAGPYDVSNAIKTLVKIEDRSASPVTYANGEISIGGGNRALRFYDVANGSYAVQRPLGTVFNAAAGEELWFGVLFRTSNASPLANQDFLQIGFDDQEDAAAGNPRVSIGANTATASFPAEFQFFARSTTAVNASAYHATLPIAAATTYLLVGCIRPSAGVYDSVSLYVNPSSVDDPGPASAVSLQPSGLATLSHFFIRTVGLDNGDAYVLDELSIGRDYASIARTWSLRDALQAVPAATPDNIFTLRWSAALTGVLLETSTTLTVDSWTEIPGPFALNGDSYEYPVPLAPGIPRGFFRLRR